MRKNVSEGVDVATGLTLVLFGVFAKVFLVLLGLFILALQYFVGIEYYESYKSWKSLSAEHISEASKWYIANRVRDIDGVSAVCVYALGWPFYAILMGMTLKPLRTSYGRAGLMAYVKDTPQT